MERLLEKWTGKVNQVTIGASADQGGTRSRMIQIGGASGRPLIGAGAASAGRPALALEVWDEEPADWPDVLKDAYGQVLSDPAAWAEKCEKEFKADLVCLRLSSTHPDRKNAPADAAAATVKKVLEATSLPLMIVGSGQSAKDTEIMMPVAEAAKNERCLIGMAVQENYRTVTAACMSSGHNIIAETPIDINLAKQLNILITDMGFPVENIVMHHATGALGYGFEYTYTIMERTRLAALQGDRMMSPPMISFIAQEVWKTKEAKTGEEQMPEWGSLSTRGPVWEFSTASGLLYAGADILVLAYPDVLKSMRKSIDLFFK